MAAYNIDNVVGRYINQIHIFRHQIELDVLDYIAEMFHSDATARINGILTHGHVDIAQAIQVSF